MSRKLFPVQAVQCLLSGLIIQVEEGEYCQQIATDNGLSLDDFVAWNPAVGADCSGLKYGYYVCMGKS